MLRTYEPCLPVRVQKAPRSDLSVHEIKHDGYRLIVRRIGKNVRLYTKNGYDWSERYRLIVEAFQSFAFRRSCLMVRRCASNPMPWTTSMRCGTARTTTPQCCAFDLLELNGEDFRLKPLVEKEAPRQAARKRQRWHSLRRTFGGRGGHHMGGVSSLCRCAALLIFALYECTRRRCEGRSGSRIHEVARRTSDGITPKGAKPHLEFPQLRLTTDARKAVLFSPTGGSTDRTVTQRKIRRFAHARQPWTSRRIFF
jgi:hypothetical protein